MEPDLRTPPPHHESLTESSTPAAGAAVRLREHLRFSKVEILVLSVLGLLVVGGASLAWARSKPVPVSLAEGAAVLSESADAASDGSLWVHVVGAVLRPGVYELPAGARGVDAVRAAGGLGRRADVLAVNLARPLQDGEQLVVPRKLPRAAQASGSAAGASSSDSAQSKVNVNTADQAALETLPGIGPTLAQRIIDYREQHGPFATVRDLVKVSGIGEKTLANLEPYVTV